MKLFRSWFASCAAIAPLGFLLAQDAPATARRRIEPIPHQSDSLRGSGRSSLPLIPSLQWSSRGDIDDTILLQPGRMFATDARLWVVDYSPPRVVQFDASSGKLLSSIGREGRGPGEWIGPLSFVGARGNEVGIFDVSTRRLAWISPANSIRSEALPTLSLAQLACASGKNGLIAAVVGRVGADVVTRIIRTAGSANTIVSNSELPWPSLRSLTPAASQVTLSATRGGCVMGPMYGSSIARFNEDGALMDTIAMIESVPLPIVETERRGRGFAVSVSSRSVRGIISLTRFGQFLVVAFGGRSIHRDRLLDFYVWESGKYVGTLLSPLELRDVKATESTLYVQSIDDVGLYRIQALRLRATSGTDVLPAKRTGITSR